MTGRPRCGHCGKPAAGYGIAADTRLCHTGTIPAGREPADCYRLVTVYGHTADGTCCRSTRQEAA